MSLETILEQIQSLPVTDRLKLVQAVWDGIEQENGELVLTDEQKAELDRRLEQHHQNPASGIPWEEIRQAALDRIDQ